MELFKVYDWKLLFTHSNPGEIMKSHLPDLNREPLGFG